MVLVVLFLVVAGGVVAAAFLLTDEDGDATLSVSDIEPMTCFDSPELGATGGLVESIEEADCDGDHDAEAFATLELGDDEQLADAGARCVDELDDLGVSWSGLEEAGIEVRPLVAGDDEGDKVVCFIRDKDGDPLSGSEFE